MLLYKILCYYTKYYVIIQNIMLLYKILCYYTKYRCNTSDYAIF